MNHKLRFGRAIATVGAAGVLLALVAAPALAQGPGLPRSYQVTPIDSPLPDLGSVFGRGMASAGDLDGDRIDDLLMPQQARSPNNDGMVFVISGATGLLIDRIDAPDAGGSGNRAGFGSFWTSKVGSRAVTMSDLGSCTGARSGAPCPGSAIEPADGIPEIVVGARGVDANGTDSGRVYIYDGATRALLKRIDMPPADAAAPNALLRGSGFGRTALNPAGMTACEGNFGVAACPAVPRAVALGDLDGGGRPDLVIGAPQLTESPATAQPGSHCARSPAGTVCEQAGRAYVYRGEDIVGSDPAVILDGRVQGQAITTIRNPDAQGDRTSGVPADNEQLANTVSAVGDLGRCREVVTPGQTCSRVGSTTTPDGVADVLISAPGNDLPLDAPDPSFANAGVAYLVDGATGAVLFTYQHPERQLGATFGSQLSSHEPAVGDLGNTAVPDLYLPAPLQNTLAGTTAGRGYVMNGNFKTGSGSVLVSRLDDPTPAKNGNFGGGSAGVGDLVADVAAPANEMLIGVEGFTRSARNDVHVFNPATEQVLQTIPDPDDQFGSAFGGAIVPLGDINGDGFLDFATSAENFTGSTGVAEGRVYVLRSDDSPAPLPPASGPTSPPSATAATPRQASRVLELDVSRDSVRAGAAVQLRGGIDATGDPAACQAGQPIEFQRRTVSTARFSTFARATSDADGTFVTTIRPRQTARYRALVRESDRCLAEASNSETVAVPPVVSVLTRSARLIGRTVRLQLSCPGGGACSGTVKLRTASRVGRGSGAVLTLGTRAFQVPAGGRRQTRISVTPRAASALRTRSRVTINVFVTSRGTAGQASFSRARLILRTR